jgi:hypothetical protein
MSALPHQLLWQVRRICEEARTLYYIEVADKVGDKYVTAYVLYRRDGHSRRGSRLCKTRSPARLLGKVRTAAGIVERTSKPAGGANDARR